MNAATALSALQAGPMAPGDFFIRSMFGVPTQETGPWSVQVTGLVEHPRSFELSELRTLGETTQLVTIECAGHGRRRMDPLPDGVPWDLGAVSVAEFIGVPLRTVLDIVAPTDDVVELVFTGADRGRIDGIGELNYSFSINVAAALEDGPALIWGMNGRPLPAIHGGPLRLLVPGHYAMTSVKWLTTITAVGQPDYGYFTERYRFFDHPDRPDGSPVDRIKVRSLITSPVDGSTTSEALELRGIAWSGYGAITSVAVQPGDRESREAELGRQRSKYAPVEWTTRVQLEPGEHVITARATDEAGNTQPISPPWNRRGFANNAVHRIGVTVS